MGISSQHFCIVHAVELVRKVRSLAMSLRNESINQDQLSNMDERIDLLGRQMVAGLPASEVAIAGIW